MSNKKMSTLTIGENTYEVVDETARAEIETLKQSGGGCDCDVEAVVEATNNANQAVADTYAWLEKVAPLEEALSEKIGEADTAIENANFAADLANNRASSAEVAAINANEKATLASNAATAALNAKTAIETARDNGEFNGKSPLKGTDYYTPADKEELIAKIVADLGSPIVGTIDDNNNIILSGELAEGEYTLKYVNAGEYTKIATITVTGDGEVTPDVPDVPDEPEEIKNRLNYGTTEVGGAEIYNGKGWAENTRWSASSNAPSTKTGMYLTGIIPVKSGDTVYTYDMPYTAGISEATYFVNYHSDGNITETQINSHAADSNNVHVFTVPDGVIGVRFSCFGISETSMVTVNQYPIE